MRSITGKTSLLCALVAMATIVPAAAEETTWVAAAAHTPGLEGALWRTDLAVLNLCPISATVEIRLHMAGSMASESFTIPAGEQQVFPDIVGSLTSEDATGSIEIISDIGVTATSRTFNQAATGTFGQALDGVVSDDGLGEGEAFVLQQLGENDAFRTNVGALNMGSEAASVSVALYDRLGSEVGTVELNVPAGRTVQENQVYRNRFGRSDIVGGYAVVTATSGSGVWPYASVVDNRTGDPTTITPKSAPDCPLDIADRLAAIDGLIAYERPSNLPGYRFFYLYFTQPTDHQDPSAGEFNQFMTLHHRSYDAPMVLRTLGYSNSGGDYQAELTEMLNANQLVVEHRYFRDSRPSWDDWSYLTIEQAAADHHRIVEAFKPIYDAAWINTGHSKGGMTAVYHRRFYPDDVDVTVPYVAPISFGAPDERYLDFLANVGAADCNQKLWDIQEETLERRQAMLDLMESRLSGVSFDRIGGAEAAFESIVLEIPFTFWQYHGENFCGFIPAVTASDASIYQFIDIFVGWGYASDATFDFFDPYFYQAHSQLGYPDVAADHLGDLIVTDPPSIEEGVVPEGTDPVFSPDAMTDVAQWLATSGERVLFVYGEFDPWTGGAFEPGDAADSYVYIDPAGTHGALIGTLTEEDQAEVMGHLERWTGVRPSPPSKKTSDRTPIWRRALEGCDDEL